MVPQLRPPPAGRRDVPSGRQGPRARGRRSTSRARTRSRSTRFAADYKRYRQIGHAGSIQTASRLDRDVVAHDGTVYRKGTAVPQRADFNTIDNPFAWSSRRSGTS